MTRNSLNITPSSVRWIGAWWFPYVIMSIISLPLAIVISGFPKRFLKEARRGATVTTNGSNQMSSRTKLIPISIKVLIRNSSFMLISLSRAAMGAGLISFFPKLIETQFNFTASGLSLFTGIAILSGSVPARLTGGFLMKKNNLGKNQIYKLLLLATFLISIASTGMLIHCGNFQTKETCGYNTWISNQSKSQNNYSTCRPNCMCDGIYSPVCVVTTGSTFRSPCSLGCFKENKFGSSYINCSYFNNNINYTMINDGKCARSCKYFPLFLVFIVLMLLISAITEVPFIKLTLAVVDKRQASLAFGLQKAMTIFLGDLPRFAIVGVLVEKSCHVWDRHKCTNLKTHCLEYNHLFRYYVFLTFLVTNLLSFLLIVIAYTIFRYKVKEGEQNDTHGNVNPTFESNES